MTAKPLYDHEAELAVLGSALLGTIAPLQADDFNDARIRRIWPELQAAFLEGKSLQYEQALDIVPLTDQAMLGEAMNTAVLTLTDYHAQRVADYSMRRSTLALFQEQAKRLYDGVPVEDVRARLIEAASSAVRRTDGAAALDVSSVYDDYWEALGNPRETWGLATGIGPIDIELGGLQINETFVVAGEPNVGKTMLVTQMAFMLAGLDYSPPATPMLRPPIPGAFYEMEMSADAIIRRAAVGLARINAHKVRTGRLSPDEQVRFVDALAKVQKAPVFLSDRTDWTSHTLRADAMRLAREEGIKWVVLDYTGLLKDNAESEVTKEMSISKAMADLAKEGLAVILVETLNKAGLRGDDSQGAVRGSVQKMYDASVVAFLQFDKTGGSQPMGDKRCILRFIKTREADVSLRIPLTLVGSQKRFELGTAGGAR